jgi:hypothetical protein
MEPQVTANKWQIIIKFSLIYALILIALNLILYILDMQNKMNVFSTIALIVITLGSVYFGILSRRDNVMDGFITYGQGVSTGMLISLVAALIVSVYSFVFATFIDPDFMQNIINQAKRDMIEKGESEEAIEMAIGMMSKMNKPWIFALMGLLGQLFYGLITSLIVSNFTKRIDPDGSYNSLSEN